jgi:hypothetical protein
MLKNSSSDLKLHIFEKTCFKKMGLSEIEVHEKDMKPKIL